MEAIDVPSALQERLGTAGTAGLLELFESARQEWTADVTIAAVERFERRLTDESANGRVALAQTEAALRLEMHQGLAALRQEIREGDTGLPQELHNGLASLRQEMREGDGSLRQAMQEGLGSLRLEMQESMGSLRLEMQNGFARQKEEQLASRFELLKWCFVFWVGQVFAMTGVVTVLLRVMRV